MRSKRRKNEQIVMRDNERMCMYVCIGKKTRQIIPPKHQVQQHSVHHSGEIGKVLTRVITAKPNICT